MERETHRWHHFHALRTYILARDALYPYYSLSSGHYNKMKSGFMKDIKPRYSFITNVIHAGLLSLL